MEEKRGSKYFVFGVGKSTPTTDPPTLSDAENEARRLARKHPDTEFIVMRAVVGIKFLQQPFQLNHYSKKG